MVVLYPDRIYPITTLLCRPSPTTDNHVCRQTCFQKREWLFGGKMQLQYWKLIHCPFPCRIPSLLNSHSTIVFVFVKLKFATTITDLLVLLSTPENNKTILTGQTHFLSFIIPSLWHGWYFMPCEHIGHYLDSRVMRSLQTHFMSSSRPSRVVVSRGPLVTWEGKIGDSAKPGVLDSLPHFEAVFVYFTCWAFS